MADDYPYYTVPGSYYNIPPQMLGPTGKVFVHPGGISTHLNMITGDVEEGKHHLVPLLVPGQEDVGDLLQGKKPTDRQVQRAVEHAKAAGNTYGFDTPEEAEDFEKEWHAAMNVQAQKAQFTGVPDEGK